MVNKMAATGLDNDVFQTVKTLAKEHNATVQEVSSTLLRMQLESLSEEQLQNLAFRRGRRPRKASTVKATAVAVNEDVESFVEDSSESADEVSAVG
jgi:hypothetical protein